MGIDGRPERDSKLKAMNRLQHSDSLDLDVSGDEGPSVRKRQPRRTTRTTKVCEDSDSESPESESDEEAIHDSFSRERGRPQTRSAISPVENGGASISRIPVDGNVSKRIGNVLDISDDDMDGQTADISNRTGKVAKKEPRGVNPIRRLKKRPPIRDEDEDDVGDEDEDEDDDVDADALLDLNYPSSAGDPDIRRDGSEPIPENRKIHLRLQISQNNGTVTKSGRISKPPKAESPVMPLRNRHRPSIEEPRQLTREERYKLRENRTGTNFGEPEYFHQSGSHRAKRRKTESVQYDEELDDEHDSEASSRDEGNTPSPSSRQRNGTTSRAAKSIDIDSPKIPQTRSSLRRQTVDVERTTPYATRHRSTINGTPKPHRSLRDAQGKESDDEAAKNDSDFQVSSSDESDDAVEDVAEERECSADGPDTSQVDFDTPDRKTRNTRKRSPRRTVGRRQSERRRAGGREKPQNTYADEFRKSFRPRNESIRPSDYYDNAGAGSDLGFSSDDDVLVAGRRPSTRRAATRATDSIAIDVNKVDPLQNPMALIDDGKSTRPKRTDRYSRHRSRLQPTGPEPYVSDDDIPGLAGVSPIEPMQVNVDLSWDDIGGLDHHIRALKEMVFLPLMYPEVFEKFSMEAPKGVLFYGPPGTGKTLCARALAASCGSEVDEVKMPSGGQLATNDSTKMNNHKLPGVSDSQTTAIKPADDPVASDKPSDYGSMGKSLPAKNIGWQGSCEIDPSNNSELVAKQTANAPGAVKEYSDVNGTTQVGGPNDSEAQNEKSSGGVKKKPRVAFFMRNGADCLSKWVGEAERQLRLTFEAAKRHQPAIIFFDEIDGLAPVRSSRQDQIHSSIVSTLLGLMDGLDSRGKIVVIGATNRVDAIDPALRRPGRFDRELIFTLPNMTARRKILGIHTSKWSPPPKTDLLDVVAKMTVGYCGADLKALCSESAIRALRRRYPQIYKENDKLLIDIDQVRVSTKDFVSAMSDVIPASHRNARTFAKPLPQRLVPVLGEPMHACIEVLKKIFIQGLPNEIQRAERAKHMNLDGFNGSDESGYLSSSDDDYEADVKKMHYKINNAGRFRRTSSLSAMRHHALRPRLLVCGNQGLGQGQLGPAILHICEGCPVHTIDFPSLHADVGARSPEEALINAFREAARSVPSILYLPHLQLWWNSASSTLRTSLIIALKDLPADLPLLVLATAEEEVAGLPPELAEHLGEIYQLRAPSPESRQHMFLPILQAVQQRPKVSEAIVKTRRRERILEVLPKAPPPKPKPLSMEEVARKMQTEERYIRMLRMEMRDFVENLLRDRRFKPFWTPVDPSSAPDYYDIIKIPMDIQKIAANVDSGCYPTVLAMVRDFDIMVKNAIEYNPPNTDIGAAILRRAHGLIDIVHAWVDNLNPSLIETCNKIIMDRVTREKEKMENVSEDGDTAKTADVERTKMMEVDSINKNEKSKKLNGIMEETRRSEKRVVDVMDVDVIAPPVEDDVRRKNAMQIAPSGLLERSQMMEVKNEIFLPPSNQQIAELEGLWLEVSSGMTVDALEGLLVRCENVLHEFRFSMDRVAALREVSTTVVLARDDPSLVGKLVA